MTRKRDFPNSHYRAAVQGEWTYDQLAEGSAVIFRKGTPGDPFCELYEPDRLGATDDIALQASEWVTVTTMPLERMLYAINSLEAREASEHRAREATDSQPSRVEAASENNHQKGEAAN